jgi:glycosyltransferase involved in cell wall biosynthesis
VPADWVARCDALDEVWVPTATTREALVAAGVASDRVAVVPEPLELDRLDRTATPLEIPGAHGTVFLAAFDWSLAKGWDVLLGAWCDAFAAGDDVTLVLKAWGTGRGIGTAEIQEELLAGLARQGRDPARMADLVIVEDLLSPHDVCRLYAAADAVVAPGRVQGWNRVPLEAMAMGRSGRRDGLARRGPRPGRRRVAGRRRPRPGPGRRGGRERVPRRAPLGRAAARRPRRRAPRRPRPPRRSPRPRRGGARAAGGPTTTARSPGSPSSGWVRSRARPRTVVAVEHDLPRVVIEGCLSGVSSLAGVNRELARALLRRGGIDLALVDTDGVGLDAAAPGMDVVAAAARRLLPGGPEVVVRQVQPPTFNRPARGRLVQVLHWEFGPLPPDWVRMIDESADEVWVASTYVRDWMIDSGVDRERLVVLPLGVDPARFGPDVPPADLGDAAPGFRFLFVGGLHARKGVDLLLDAYERAFRRSDDVTLVVKDFGPLGPYPPGRLDERVRAMAESTTGPRVLHLSAPIAEEAMPGLYTACHCLVHPCRGEAYGLTIAEAMACGLPVVVPDRGAARDFTDPSNAFLVPSRQVELPFGEASSYRMDRNPVVHEVDPADLAAAMRAVHDDQVAANVIGARASRAIRSGHTWDRTAAVAAERIALLTGRLAGLSAA